MQEPIVCKRDHKRAIDLIFLFKMSSVARILSWTLRYRYLKGLEKMPEIRSYMEEFPFPFYIILLMT